jgi:hypothetical protein
MLTTYLKSLRSSHRLGADLTTKILIGIVRLKVRLTI